MKIKVFLVLIIICTYIYGQNIKDFNSLMSYQNENGVCLKSYILPFKMYDYSKDSSKFVNITVVGCVHRPGVFIVPDGTTLEFALGMAAPIKKEEHPVHALGVSFLFRDKSFIRLDHDTNKSHKLLHGDVIYVENSVF